MGFAFYDREGASIRPFSICLIGLCVTIFVSSSYFTIILL